MRLPNIGWETSVFFSRWKNRLHYLFKAPFAYKNWWMLAGIKFHSGACVLELRDGSRYWVRPGTTDLGVINELALLNPYLGPGYLTISSEATVVDVGANIGDFTIQSARLCTRGWVFAIEPIAANCACIQRQLDLNGVRNVIVMHAALGDHDGETNIHRAGGKSSVYWGEDEAEKVRLSSLESLMKEYGIDTIDLLKLDCEGAEWDILPAAEHLLPRIQQICLEYHNAKLNADWLEQWLQRHGFRIERTRGEWNGLLWAWKPQ